MQSIELMIILMLSFLVAKKDNVIETTLLYTLNSIVYFILSLDYGLKSVILYYLISVIINTIFIIVEAIEDIVKERDLSLLEFVVSVLLLFMLSLIPIFNLYVLKKLLEHRYEAVINK